MNKPIFGIQLFTLRDYCKNPVDFKETISFVKSLGSSLVQVSGVGSEEPIPALFQKEVMEKEGVEICVTHTPWQRIVEDTDNVIAEHKLYSCRCVGLGAASYEQRGTVEAVDRFIADLEPALKKLKANGMTFNYHNHDFELEEMDNGVKMLDYLIENTDPEVFHFTPDVAWIHYAGCDPVEYLYKMKNRAEVCHFKDYDIVDGERKFVTLGEGKVDLKACYEACIDLGIPYIVYEQDCDWVDGDVKKATELSWAYMKSLEA